MVRFKSSQNRIQWVYQYKNHNLNPSQKSIRTVIDEDMDFIELGLDFSGKRPNRFHASDVQLLIVQLCSRGQLAVLQVFLDHFFRFRWIADTCCYCCCCVCWRSPSPVSVCSVRHSSAMCAGDDMVIGLGSKIPIAEDEIPKTNKNDGGKKLLKLLFFNFRSHGQRIPANCTMVKKMKILEKYAFWVSYERQHNTYYFQNHLQINVSTHLS